MRKLYFEHLDSEACYSEMYFQNIMKDRKISSIEVFDAQKLGTKEYFWCKEHQLCFESGEGFCGLNCDEYKPRNGKSGRCVHHSNTFEHGEKTILKLI